MFTYIATFLGLSMGYILLAMPARAPSQHTITVLQEGTRHLSFQQLHQERGTKDEEFYTIDLTKVPEESVNEARVVQGLVHADRRKEHLVVYSDWFAPKAGCEERLKKKLATYQTALQQGQEQHPEHFAHVDNRGNPLPRPIPSASQALRDTISGCLPERKPTETLIRIKGIESFRRGHDQENLDGFAQLTYYDPVLDNLESADCILYRTLGSPFVSRPQNDADISNRAQDSVDIHCRTIAGFHKGALAAASISVLERISCFATDERSVGLVLKPKNVHQAFLCAEKRNAFTTKPSQLYQLEGCVNFITRSLQIGVAQPKKCLHPLSNHLLDKPKRTRAKKSYAQSESLAAYSEILLATEHVDIVGLFLLTDAQTVDELRDTLHQRCVKFAQAKGLPLLAIRPEE